MKLSTIWSLPAMSYSDRVRLSKEALYLSIAHRLPSKLRYWVTIAELGKATRDSANIPATPLSDILEKLEGGPK